MVAAARWRKRPPPRARRKFTSWAAPASSSRPIRLEQMEMVTTRYARHLRYLVVK
jgi:hypothetical protein